MRLVRASLLGLAVAGAVGVPIAVIAMVGLGALAGQRAGLALAAGQSHDGLPLRGGHQGSLQGGQLMRVQYGVAGGAAGTAAVDAAAAVNTPATASANDPNAIAAPPALAVRQGCAWGQPGRNPYRGSTEQALAAARLPPEVVQQIAAMRLGGHKSGRLQITTAAIRSDDGTRQFDPRALAMSFGNTLCLHSRVNFAPGHTELADLYEARDSQGRLYAVMVPDVCGNVTVLAPLNKRGVVAGMAGLLAQRSRAVAALADALADGEGTGAGEDAGPGAGIAAAGGAAASATGGARPTARSSGKVDAGPAQADTAGQGATQGPLGRPLADAAAPDGPGSGGGSGGTGGAGSTGGSAPTPVAPALGAAPLADLTAALLPRSVVVPALKGLADALAKRSQSLAGLAGVLGDHESPPSKPVLRPDGTSQTVAEPGTLACVLAALAGLAALGALRGAARPRSSASSL